MSRHDWYRNTDWDAEISERFFARLARAKRKAQYLRIQACVLCRPHPQVALWLLDRYFALNDHFDDVVAFAHQAEALLALGEEDKAIEAYERALARQDEFPNAQGDASRDLPLLIATCQRRDKYGRALELLARKETTLLFPVQVFKHAASVALIASDLGDAALARQHAARAIEMAEAENSGLRYHPNVGLVGSRYEAVMELLRALVTETAGGCPPVAGVS